MTYLRIEIRECRVSDCIGSQGTFGRASLMKEKHTSEFHSNLNFVE